MVGALLRWLVGLIEIAWTARMLRAQIAEAVRAST